VEALEGLDQPAAAIAFDLARGPIHKLLAARGFFAELLAVGPGLSLSTIYSWNSSGYGPPFVKLGNLVRYTYEDVELRLARQLELSR
jgi:hypothetical protein